MKLDSERPTPTEGLHTSTGRAAKAPRTAKRCFCGESSMLRAAERYFDCCRRAGVVILGVGR
jgi:hypothetical protein